MNIENIYQQDSIIYKHLTDQFWELNFEALEANGGQNAPKTSGDLRRLELGMIAKNS